VTLGDISSGLVLLPLRSKLTTPGPHSPRADGARATRYLCSDCD